MNRRNSYTYRSSRAPEDFFDKFEKHPIRNVILAWLGIALLNLLIWGGLFIGALLAVKAIFF